MLRAIVFDFDGVIANSEPLHFLAFRDVLAENGLTLTETAYYDRYLGFDDVKVFEAVAADHGVEWSDERRARFAVRKAARMEELEHGTSVLFPGAEAAIRRAAALVPLAIASGALGVEIRRVLDRADLTSSFRAIVSAEDTAQTKPAPDPYLRAVSLLSDQIGTLLAPASCVAIEDSRWGIASARTAGLRTVGVTTTYHRNDLAEADLIIASIDDLDMAALDRLCAD